MSNKKINQPNTGSGKTALINATMIYQNNQYYI